MKTLITICLLNKTNHFLLLLITLALVFSYASAEIKYKEIDTTISELSLNQSQRYQLDMNNDGINEYFFNHGNQMGDIVCEIYSEPTSFTNEILVDNGTPTILGYLEEISESLSEWLNTYNGVGTNALYFLGNWPGSVEKYVAVRFKINNSYHYGWIGIEIPSDSTYIKIKDCAYEDVAGQSILAGDKDVDYVQEISLSNNPIIYSYKKNIFIKLTSDIKAEIRGELYDINGNLKLSFVIEQETTELNLENLNTGIYFIRLNFDNKMIRRKNETPCRSFIVILS